MLMEKNSLPLILTISTEMIQDNPIMMSFDEEWLFTNVRVKDAVQAALQKLESD